MNYYSAQSRTLVEVWLPKVAHPHPRGEEGLMIPAAWRLPEDTFSRVILPSITQEAHEVTAAATGVRLPSDGPFGAWLRGQIAGFDQIMTRLDVGPPPVISGAPDTGLNG